MLPHDKGWLRRYLDYRKDSIYNQSSYLQRGSHPERSLYSMIQPTGIMYGQMVGTTNLPIDHWGARDKMKILLAESFVNSSLLYQDRPSGEEDASRVITNAVDNIGRFYSNIFPEMAPSSKSFFGKKKTPLEIAERILERRVDTTDKYENNFWAQFFHNSLLFLDIFIFGQWIHTNADKIVADFFRYERDELRASMVKVIALAAHANKEVSFEEKKLFELFLQSTELTTEKRKEALSIFETGIEMHDLNLPAENSWILKKYFLEMAILTIWADKKVENIELEFLKSFCKYLNFADEDLENSMLAVEGFILEHWEQLDYLQSRKQFEEVSQHFILRLAAVASKNETRLVKELRSRHVLIRLIKKAGSQELSETEKETVRKELIQLLKVIPNFEMITLPQKFLTFNTLLKVIPKKLFLDLE